MTIDININDITQPVIKETSVSSLMKRFLVNRIESYFVRKTAKMILSVEETILKIEGSHVHLKKLSPKSAKEILPDITKAIEVLEKRFYILEEIKFFDSRELRDKYNYLLATVYKSETITFEISKKNKSKVIEINSLFETNYLNKTESNKKRLKESINQLKLGELKKVGI